MMDRFSDDYRFSNVSRGEPSFSTNGTVTEMTVVIQFEIIELDYVGIIHVAVNSSTLYAFSALSATDQITRYQPVFQNVWDSATIPGTDLEPATEPSRRPVISGGWSAGDGEAGGPDDSEERSGGRSRAGAQAGTGGKMAY